jgi:hypothetical protein
LILFSIGPALADHWPAEFLERGKPEGILGA